MADDFTSVLLEVIRKVVNQLPFTKLKNAGDHEHFVRLPSKDIAITNWKDSKDVKFITNYSSTEEVNLSYRRRGNDTDTPMVSVAKDYRASMGNVDSFDRNRKLYCMKRTVRRWWLSIFLFVLDIVVINCWKMYLHNNPDLKGKGRTQKEFRRLLATALIGKGIRKRKPKIRVFVTIVNSPSCKKLTKQ